MNKQYEISFSQIREELDGEKIKAILLKYDVHPVYENENYIIFPTVCHNLSGGSHKLYFFKSSHLFYCFTECNESFDILTLLQKMHKLRGEELTLSEIIRRAGIEIKTNFGIEQYNNKAELSQLYTVLKSTRSLPDLPQLDKKILNRFVFDKGVLKIWKDEGISFNTMEKYGIKYDPIENCIIIPNYDINNNLISIRGRFLGEDAAAKYKPIVYGRKVLSHPSAFNLYGININKAAIQASGKAIIFEGEKSVLMMDTYYGNNNCSLATLGKNISIQQIRLLTKLGVSEVIIAFDRDYTDYKTMCQKRAEYQKLAKNLKSYFNVSIIMDLDCSKLGYKDSPIDKGKEVFEELLNNRMYV